MKYLILALVFVSLNIKAQSFESEARLFAKDLKMSMVTGLTKQIKKGGVPSAIPFCHENIKPIAKKAAKDRMKKFEFGRTSHKLRNQENKPKA